MLGSASCVLSSFQLNGGAFNTMTGNLLQAVLVLVVVKAVPVRWDCNCVNKSCLTSKSDKLAAKRGER